jgi:hypothetical protein
MFRGQDWSLSSSLFQKNSTTLESPTLLYNPNQNFDHVIIGWHTLPPLNHLHYSITQTKILIMWLSVGTLYHPRITYITL